MDRPAGTRAAKSFSARWRLRQPGCNAPVMGKTSAGMLRAMASPHLVRGSAAQLVGQQTTRLTAGDRTGVKAPRPEDSAHSTRVAAHRLVSAS